VWPAWRCQPAVARIRAADLLKTQREALDRARQPNRLLQNAAEHRDAQLESQQK